MITQNALAITHGETPDLRQAALTGLLRTAHSEHPGRIRHIDTDTTQATHDTLHHTLHANQSQTAIRQGTPHTPQLRRLKVEKRESAPPFDSGGTVLVTGGTGGLGVLVARHLARVHGVRRLLLVSRHGPDAEGARELVAELEELGCATQVVACDVSDRGQVEGLILGVPEEHPLTMVIHAAGVLDDGVIKALDERRLAGVMAPKVDGAVASARADEGFGVV